LALLNIRAKAPHSYFAQYAAKGDKLFGYEFTKDGVYSKNGIDLKFGVKEYDYASGKTSINENDKRNGFDICINIDPRGLSLYSMAEAILHEGLLEADYLVKDVLVDRINDYSNIDTWVKKTWLKGDVSQYGHGQNYVDRSKFGGENLIWPGKAYKIFQDVNNTFNNKLTNNLSSG
jgi:hypothetical protein